MLRGHARQTRTSSFSVGCANIFEVPNLLPLPLLCGGGFFHEGLRDGFLNFRGAMIFFSTEKLSKDVQMQLECCKMMLQCGCQNFHPAVAAGIGEKESVGSQMTL